MPLFVNSVPVACCLGLMEACFGVLGTCVNQEYDDLHAVEQAQRGTTLVWR